MRSLDFMIVGAQKCGTTALSEFLAEHPGIEMAAEKEAHVFDAESFSDELTSSEINKIYEPLFSGNDRVQKGEATPVYLYLPEIAARLSRYNSCLKVIVLLRDPVERAYSHYVMERGRGNEFLPFFMALLMEPIRLFLDRKNLGENSSRRRHSYQDRSFYSRQLVNLFQEFPEKQVLVLSTDNLRQNHDETMGRIYEFLGVEPYDVSPREVFSQASSTKEVPVSSFVLKWVFRKDRRKLANFIDFSI